MSRPSTPLGLSPRGSFANLADAIPGTPRDEKIRIKAEMDLQAALQSQADIQEKAKKEETGMPVASPGKSHLASGDHRSCELKT